MNNLNTTFFLCLFSLLIFHNIVNAQNDLSNGLRSYHPFNGDYYTANNRAESHFAFSNSSFTADSNGTPNNSLSLNGAQRVNMYDNIIGTSVGGFSVDLWFNSSATGRQVMVWEGQTGQQSFWLRMEPASNRIKASVGTPTSFLQVVTTSPFNDGAWHHIAVVGFRVNGPDSLKIYVDGQLNNVATGGWSNVETTNFTRVGARDDLSGQFFDGKLDELRIWSRKLIDSEVKELYELPRIQMGSLPNKQFCINDTFQISFDVFGGRGSFDTANVFTLQVSDNLGSFEFPKTIGTLKADSSGTITGIIPPTLATDSSYRLRLVASHSSKVSDSTITIQINNPVAFKGYDVLSNLLLHYPFDGNVFDATGNNNNGTRSGSTNFVNDRFEDSLKAIAFGSNGRVTVGKPFEIDRFHNQRKPISFSFWYRTTAAQNAVRDIFTCFSAGASNGLYIGTSTNGRVRFRINSSSPFVEASYKNDNTWQHFVGTYDGTDLKLYRDNVLISTASPSSKAINISRIAQIGSNSDPFNAIAELFGDLDDFRMYDRELTPEEVEILYNNGIASSNAPLCLGDTLALKAPVFPGLLYDWQGPNNFSAAISNPTVNNISSILQFGEYTLLTELNGCTSDSQKAMVNPAVDQPILPDSVALCAGDSILLVSTGTDSLQHYRWYADSLATILLADSTDSLWIQPLVTTKIYVRLEPDMICMSPLQVVNVRVNDLPIVVANASTTTVCEGDSLLLFGSGASSFSWNLGVRDSVYFVPSQDTSYEVIGTSNEGCTNTASVFIDWVEISRDTVSASSCDNFIWSQNSQNYSLSGIYSDTLVSIFGCDSIINLDLTINRSTNDTFNIQACEVYTWPLNSTVYSMSGIYRDTLLSTFGCDSIQVLNLTINRGTSDTIAVSACDNYIWAVNSNTYSSSGSYRDTLSTIFGCDSIVTLDLTINRSTSDTTAAASCDSYNWSQNNQTFFSSGFYQDTLTSAFGCDSIQVLNLTINRSTSDTIAVSSCNTYMWTVNNNTYNSSGFYRDTLSTVFGCDSIITLDLTINRSTSDTLSTVSCDSYTWPHNNLTYFSSGFYQDTLTSAFGCDSILNLQLTINQTTRDTSVVVACENYLWNQNNMMYVNSGIYADTLLSSNNCDSINVLVLTVDPPIQSGFVQQGDSLISNEPSGSIYSWFNCNNPDSLLGSGSSRSFQPALNGQYAVIVVKGSCRDTSVCDDFIFTGLSEQLLTEKDLKIYPNPSSGQIQIEIPTKHVGQNILIFNSVGKLVARTRAETKVVHMDVANLEVGLYTVRVGNTQGRLVIVK